MTWHEKFVLGRLCMIHIQPAQWPPSLRLFNFSLVSNIIYIPSLWVKAQSDTHYSSKKI